MTRYPNFDWSRLVLGIFKKPLDMGERDNETYRLVSDFVHRSTEHWEPEAVAERLERTWNEQLQEQFEKDFHKCDCGLWHRHPRLCSICEAAF